MTSHRGYDAVLHSAMINLISKNLFIAHILSLMYCEALSPCLKSSLFASSLFFSPSSLLSHQITGVCKKHCSDLCTLSCRLIVMLAMHNVKLIHHLQIFYISWDPSASNVTNAICKRSIFKTPEI